MELARIIFYYYANNIPGKVAYRDLKSLRVTYDTIHTVYGEVRSMISKYIDGFNSTRKLGGPDKIVEIDEALFSRNTNKDTGEKHQVWVLGIFEVGTRVARAYVIKDKTAETLQDIIVNHVEEGSTICTDCWKGYIGLKDKGFRHKRINHRKGWIHNGYTTNRVEGLWKQLRRFVRRYSGLKSYFVQDIINEALWRRYISLNKMNPVDELVRVLRMHE